MRQLSEQHHDSCRSIFLRRYSGRFLVRYPFAAFPLTFSKEAAYIPAVLSRDRNVITGLHDDIGLLHVVHLVQVDQERPMASQETLTDLFFQVAHPMIESDMPILHVEDHLAVHRLRIDDPRWLDLYLSPVNYYSHDIFLSGLVRIDMTSTYLYIG